MGAEILSQLFESVEVKVQTRTSRVPEARVVRDYVASTGDLHATLLSKPGAWEEVLDRVTAQAQQVIDSQGFFPVTSRTAVFVCHGGLRS